MSALNSSFLPLPSRFSASRPARSVGGETLVTITEVAAALLQVTPYRHQRAALQSAWAERFGFALPGPGASHSAQGMTALWLYPTSWLIQSDTAAVADGVADWAARHAALAAWVEQSHGRTILRVSGAPTRAVLARLCRLDLHERVFAPGACAATLVGHVECLLRRVPQENTYEQAQENAQKNTQESATNGDAVFDLLVGSSHADWLLDELTTAAATCGWRFLAHPTHEEQQS